MRIEDVREGMRVMLAGPGDHPLHKMTGTVVYVRTPGQMWQRRPMEMMGSPFAWLDGQAGVTLDKRPPAGVHERIWTPVVDVSPADLEEL